MNDHELQRLLQQAQVPERPPEYWEEFPDSVGRALRRSDRPEPSAAHRPAHPRLWPRLAWRLGLAAACVFVGLIVGLRLGRDSGPDAMTRAELGKYLREIETLFPGQVRAIVFENDGPRLVLSDKPDVPTSPAVFVRICVNEECRSFITFSGQRVGMKGEEFEVLMDAKGGVIVVGKEAVWSSAGARSARLPFRIEATTLTPSEISG